MKKFVILFLFILLLFNYAYNIEPNRMLIRKTDLSLNNWDKAFNGIKVLVLSDLHIGTNKVSLSRLKEIVNSINKQGADIVFILGDFDAESIYYSKIPPDDISTVLSQINSHFGVYAVLGNHDYRPENIVRPILKKAGVTLLEEDSVSIKINGKMLQIFGIQDWWHYNTDVNKFLSDVSGSVILLSHNPDAFPEVPNNIALTLSGHTHGGEIALPIIGGLHIPSVYGRKYAKGLVKEGEKILYVTSGVASLSRMRTFNPPEMVLLNLKRWN